MMEDMQSKWVQFEIMNKTKILTKRGSDEIHDVIPTKYQKYPSNTILKYANVLAKVNKLTWGRVILYDVTWRLQYSDSSTYNDSCGH